MTYLVELSTRAERDYRSLYVEKNAAESRVAARWFNGLASALEGLASLPHRCPLAPEAGKLNMELRQLLYGKKPHIYRIVYEVDEARRTVWVITIRHGARLPSADLGQ
jgi:toxin ParE1/3/4